MPSYDPQKPCDNHNPRNRRGGKSRRSRYTLPPQGMAETRPFEAVGITCQRFVVFHDSQRRGVLRTIFQSLFQPAE